MSATSVLDANAPPRKPGDTLGDGRPQENRLKELVGISGPVPRWIPMTLLAFSSVAIVAPVILFRRYKASLGHSHVDAQSLRSAAITSTAPPRRGKLREYTRDNDTSRSQMHPSAASSSSSASTPPLRTRGKVPTLPASPKPPHHSHQSARVHPSVATSETPTGSEDHFNAPLYTLKAFSIATVIVISSAAATVAGVMSYLNVRDTTEFAACMRTWVSNSMPVLSAQIYRRLEPQDSLPGDALLPNSASSQSEESSKFTPFDHNASQQRLAEAFDKGGFDAWAEAAEKEMEAEIEVERSRKKQESHEMN